MHVSSVVGDVHISVCVCFYRDNEYKGLQLSLDQVTTTKPTFPYNSTPNPVTDNRRPNKTRAARTKGKTRLSPYPQVSVCALCGFCVCVCACVCVCKSMCVCVRVTSSALDNICITYPIKVN